MSLNPDELDAMIAASSELEAMIGIDTYTRGGTMYRWIGTAPFDAAVNEQAKKCRETHPSALQRTRDGKTVRVVCYECKLTWTVDEAGD